MRFVISTYFYVADFNNSHTQRLEIKTNELQKAFEICRAFVMGSKSCLIDIWENENRTKKPNYSYIIRLKHLLYKDGFLTNEILFNNFILNLKKGVNNV